MYLVAYIHSGLKQIALGIFSRIHINVESLLIFVKSRYMYLYMCKSCLPHKSLILYLYLIHLILPDCKICLVTLRVRSFYQEMKRKKLGQGIFFLIVANRPFSLCVSIYFWASTFKKRKEYILSFFVDKTIISKHI